MDGNRAACNKGFTLVEMSIVLIVIGLLVGGIIKGKELIDTSKVTKTITIVKSIDTGTKTFQNKYNYLPGDFLFAVGSLPECTPANFCQNGGGNGRVDNNITNSDPNWAQNVSTDAAYYETIQFWKHLAMADMITGVDFTADPAQLQLGKTHLASPFYGGFEVYFDPVMVFAGGTERRTGHNIRWSRTGPTGGAVSAITGRGAIRPSIAAEIDRKIDDGMPHSGWVTANYGSVSDNCKSTAGYVETFEGDTCNMYFMMQ